ncbi:MAG: PKD domain-containing protein [Holophagaceae bacterium]|nr:PKD domain-containing protein [Holophagaceae bacterium]
MRRSRLAVTLGWLLLALACNRSGGGGSAPVAPAAAFTVAPASPVAGATVQFTDTSAGAPTTWSWSFGDGSGSPSQHPNHVFAQPGTYSVTLTVSNAGGTASLSRTLAVEAPGVGTAFTGNVVLGSPTTSSVHAVVYAPDQAGAVRIAYGAGGLLDRQTATVPLSPATPLDLILEGLPPDSACNYRLMFQAAGGAEGVALEGRFRTARSPGASFTFCLQGDSHPEREGKEFSPELYRRTLATAAADRPDFYLALGDDFSVDTLNPLTVTQAQVVQRYTLQRPYLGIIGSVAPVFLVNGNHEQAARYLLDGTPGNVAVWAQNARNAHYAQPAPDGFYTGNPEQVPFIGLLRNHYAWTWGDALFVVLDPYWSSPVCVDNPFYGGSKHGNLWDVTHGDAQYQWLKTTLEQSRATYKFVFAHHVLGTQRGGVELATQYEWGGYSGNGVWGLSAYRPTWTASIHQLLVANKVTAFFQGHDHIWVRQALDGVTYQTLSEPADPFYALYNADAYLSGDRFPNSGYTRVTVAPGGVTVSYVRCYLPADEGPGKMNGQLAFSYTLPPR